MSEIKRTAIYVRVSTDEQKDFGYSIDDQIRELTGFCEKNNFTVVGIYNDAGHSAKDLNRPNMQRLIDDIKGRKINAIVALKLDRISRDSYDSQWFKKLCAEYECEIYLVSENYDLTTLSGNMMYGITSLFAEHERKEIGRRTKRGLDEIARQGKYPQRAPLGYIRNKDGYLEIETIGAEVVRDIFRYYSEGMSVLAIVDKLNKDNRYYGTYGKWEERKVNLVLTNKLYIGTLEWGKTRRKKEDRIVIEDHSPVIIDKELFELCEFRRDQNKHGNYGKESHIFHRVIRCIECNSIMHSYYCVKKKNNKKQKYFFVRCKNKTCSLCDMNYNTKKIEEDFVRVLKKINKTDLLKKEKLKVPYIENQKEIDEIDKAINKLNNQEKKLLDLIINSEMSQDIINEKINIITSERSSLLDKKIKLQYKGFVPTECDIETLFTERRLRGFDNVEILWQLLSRKSKSEIVSNMIKSIYLSRDENYKIEIEMINFRSDFLQNKLVSLDEILEQKLADEYKDKEIIKRLKEEELRKLLVVEEKKNINFKNSLNMTWAQKLQHLNELLLKENNLGVFVHADSNGLPVDLDYTY